MQLTLTREEVATILLARVNETFSTNFDKVTFDGYTQFKVAAFEIAKPEVPEVLEVLEVGSAS